MSAEMGAPVYPLIPLCALAHPLGVARQRHASLARFWRGIGAMAHRPQPPMGYPYAMGPSRAPWPCGVAYTAELTL